MTGSASSNGRLPLGPNDASRTRVDRIVIMHPDGCLCGHAGSITAALKNLESKRRSVETELNSSNLPDARCPPPNNKRADIILPPPRQGAPSSSEAHSQRRCQAHHAAQSAKAAACPMTSSMPSPSLPTTPIPGCGRLALPRACYRGFIGVNSPLPWSKNWTGTTGPR